MSELLPAQRAVHPAPSPPPSTNEPCPQAPKGAEGSAPDPDPVLCHHCGRTASNGISCQGYCVADSNY